jgi:hypothetical protein
VPEGLDDVQGYQRYLRVTLRTLHERMPSSKQRGARGSRSRRTIHA